MARGFDGIREFSEKLNERKNQRSTRPSRLYLKVISGYSVNIRFLEEGDDVVHTFTHKVQRPDQPYPNFIPCRDADETGEVCPACELDIPKSFRGYINVIWRNAPKYKLDQNGRFVISDGSKVPIGREDQVALWEQGITVFRTLDKKDATFKGLTSRDFVVFRDGEGFDTTYSIEPADADAGPIPLSDNDKKLANEKYDLTEISRAPTVEQWNVILGNIDTENEENKDEIASTGSPFSRDVNMFARD